MRKVFFLMSLLLFASLVSKANITFTMDDTKIKPSGKAELAVNVTNDETFAGFELKIFLPDGISFQGTKRTERVQGSDRLEGFTITGSNQNDGSYKISVANFDGDLIQPGEGPLFYILIQADDNANLGIGELKLANVRYSKDEVLHTLDDVTANINIYDNVTVTATSANSEMGSVTGGGEFESGTNVTLTATATEGYHFVKWSNDVTDNPYTFVVTAAVSLTATFAPNQYKMTFVLNNGEDDIVKTLDYKSELTAPADVKKKGHTLIGWDPEVPATVPLGDKTFTAQWEVNTYNVIYMVYGEEWARDEYTYGSPITLRKYEGTILDDFKGWTSDAEYTTMPDHDIIYTANITKLDPINITADMIQNISDYDYTGEPIEPVLTVKYGDYTLVAGTDYSVSYSDNTDAGTATATVTAIAGGYFAGSANKTFSILQVDATVIQAPVGLLLGYTGQAQNLINPGSGDGGTMQYSLDNETYSIDIPTGTEIMEYTVYYKVVGDKNHKDTKTQTVTANIVKGIPVDVAAGEYATYYSDKVLKLNTTETDAKLYTVTDVTDKNVIVSEVPVAAAETPLLVYNSSSVTKTVVLVPTLDAPANIAVYNGFKGTLTGKEMPASGTTDYYVCNGKDFVWVRDGGTIAANRCWLEMVKSTASAPSLSIVVGEGTTGIQTIDNKQVPDGIYYDLNGRTLQGTPTKKGLYIMNGKKVVIR